MTRQPKHQCQSMLGHCDRISARRIHYYDAALGGCLQVDVVHAHARAPDHAQLRSLVHHGGVNEYRRAHQQGISVGEFGYEGAFSGITTVQSFCSLTAPVRRVRLFQRRQFSRFSGDDFGYETQGLVCGIVSRGFDGWRTFGFSAVPAERNCGTATLPICKPQWAV